MISMINSIN